MHEKILLVEKVSKCTLGPHNVEARRVQTSKVAQNPSFPPSLPHKPKPERRNPSLPFPFPRPTREINFDKRPSSQPPTEKREEGSWRKRKKGRKGRRKFSLLPKTFLRGGETCGGGFGKGERKRLSRSATARSRLTFLFGRNGKRKYGDRSRKF